MPIALTDDHRELGGVARSFLTAQKARWAARELLDTPTGTRPAFWRELAELWLAGTACRRGPTVAPDSGCPSWWW